MNTEMRLLRWTVALLTWSITSTQEMQEYCFPNAFNASCESDEVILMREARYGRMKKGLCINNDYYIGCSADVLPQLDLKCSGRRFCHMKIPDTTLYNLQPCPKDMATYLEASYSCIKVHTGGGHSCDYSSAVVTNNSGFLASIVTEELALGSTRCPWKISLPEGLQINITLLDFGVAARYVKSGNMCHMYAKIKERGLPSDITICGTTTRHRSVFVSESNHVEITILNFKMQSQPNYFILKYEAIGCGNPSVPPGAWLSRSRNKATISCNFTTQVWHIVCHNNRWIGDITNCTIASMQPPRVGTLTTTNMQVFPVGLVIAIVVGVLLGLLIGGTLLVFVVACHKRKGRRPAEDVDIPESLYASKQDRYYSGCNNKPVVMLPDLACPHGQMASMTPPVTEVKRDTLVTGELNDTREMHLSTSLQRKSHTYEKPEYMKDIDNAVCIEENRRNDFDHGFYPFLSTPSTPYNLA